MSRGQDDIAERWRREAVRRAAAPFGLACAALPVLDQCEQHSLIEQIAAGLQAGALPAVPASGWLWIGYFAALAAAAAVLLTRRPSRARWRLFAACAGLHVCYALATGLRTAVLVGLGLFAWSFVALQAADALERG
ncbi:hypothetical protein SAMN02745121_04408 [Nannocystis exedens]|uniref:Uncharacterized protein n=1 Tax=Nannocystis exedens TaxID=54 RepID=A0A1I2AVX3_9BACT|nr:hypothetical protein [Nannocystis exedens]PCC74307.1 hypothetical protein NAEX_07396 [Nannocystis exedens]SFE48052.1 hypothetical protein SAMN02745121_04408 [Nannocystis exedens]